VNTKNGFYWLYCKILQDANGPWFSFQANTLNATNPNGAGSYNLESFADILVIVEHGNSTEQDGAANGSQPFRSETNAMSSEADSRR
jgi:hypothetical protein